MSQHSALASLTAQYTDSEDEVDDEVEGESFQPAVVQISKNFSAACSPPTESDVIATTLFPESQKVVDSGRLSGLVSYQDDLIDDDPMDHVYMPDHKEREEIVEEDRTCAASEVETEMETDKPVKNGDPAVEVVDLEGDEPPKKKSLIPPEPSGKCSSELQEKFAKMLEKKIKGGLDMNLAIQRNKNFRNPSIYEKLIKYCDIDELGSNYPSTVFDPHEWHESSYYDELAKAQKELMEKRERERKERTKVDFVSGTVKKPTTASSYEMEPKRKSKWDQRGVMPPLLLPTSYPQTSSLLPFTNTASGTKSTVINAFGNINRKQK